MIKICLAIKFSSVCHTKTGSESKTQAKNILSGFDKDSLTIIISSIFLISMKTENTSILRTFLSRFLFCYKFQRVK